MAIGYYNPFIFDPPQEKYLCYLEIDQIPKPMIKVTKRSLYDKIVELQRIIDGNNERYLRAEKEFKETLNRMPRFDEKTLINNIKSDREKIEALQETVNKLQFKIDNPPKYKVGDIVKGKIITKIDIVNNICGMFSLRISELCDNVPENTNIYKYRWEYSYTDTKTGETGTL